VLCNRPERNMVTDKEQETKVIADETIDER
jgi:hypothetical protein